MFQNLSPERVSTIRKALTDEQWHLLGEDARETFLYNYLPEEEFVPFYELLSDFRFGGYRILGDLICDMDDEFRALGNKQLVREGDSYEFGQLMAAYTEKSVSQYYKDAVTKKCRELLEGILKPGLAVRYVVALGKRKLIWELLLDKVEENILKVEVTNNA